MTTILFFIIALGILIFVHELGHFILAKRAGIKVEEFSFGFGPRLVGIKRGETDYRLSLLPFGGYVKMLGEDPTDPQAKDPRSFTQKTIWQRTKVILFGPLMNLFLCFLLMPIVFMIGRSQPAFLDQKPVLMGVRAESPAAEVGLKEGDRIVTLDGKKVGSWETVLNKVLITAPGNKVALEVERDGRDFTVNPTVGEMPEFRGGYLGIAPMLFLGNEATVDGVMPGRAADEAGLKKGDKIVSLNGQPVKDWFDLIGKVDENKGEEATVKVLRGDERLKFKITPEYNEGYDRWLIGIRKDRNSGVPMIKKRYGPIDAVIRGTQENIKILKITFSVLKRLVTFKLSYKVLGGPIVIAKTSAAAASEGLSHFFYFLAFLSLQLAIINLLPIPVLDGGHLVFLGIETIRRRPVSERIRGIATQVGFVLLLSLMFLVTINDIEHVWGIRKLLDKIF
jgi:regulator of sigma E protease